MYSSLHISDRSNLGRSRIRKVNTTHLVVPARLHTCPVVLHANYRLSNKYRFSCNYFVTGEDNKADFSIPSNTIVSQDLRFLVIHQHHNDPAKAFYSPRRNGRLLSGKNPCQEESMPRGVHDMVSKCQEDQSQRGRVCGGDGWSLYGRKRFEVYEIKVRG
jgi:hypothetical protein